jgi:A/G-specific adenine glycosylase
VRSVGRGPYDAAVTERRSAAHPRRQQGQQSSNPPALDPRRVRWLRKRLLDWAVYSGRTFYWRRPKVGPFTIFVTEILLAKTRAELVADVGAHLLARFSNPRRLATARVRDVERILYPLGLQRKRARNLVDCARALLDEHEGAVPSTIVGLMQLPSVGRYAAHAIASVAFDQPVAVLDANVARIYQRVFSLPPPPERLAIAHDLWAAAERILPKRDAKRFNWAILDLGGTVCTAKAPLCTRCPLAKGCDYATSKMRTTLRTPSRRTFRP